MKYTMLDVQEQIYVPEELLEEMPDESTLIASAGADLSDLEPELVTIAGNIFLTIPIGYEGPEPLPGNAIKLDVTYSRENYNAIWYVIGRLPDAKVLVMEGEENGHY